ncbi:Protein kinase domain containing protein [Entamoeba marina]
MLTLFSAEQVFAFPMTLATGVDVDSKGYMMVSGYAKCSLASISGSDIETVRTDGPFRSLTSGYVPIYSSNLDQFFVLGRDRARVGRFSEILVGDFIDYEPTFEGSSTLFIEDDTLTLGLVPKSSDGSVKVCEVSDIPRLDDPVLTTNDVKNSISLDSSTINNVGKGAATICVKDSEGNCNYLLFVLFDSLSENSAYSNTTILKLFTLSSKRDTPESFYDTNWETTYDTYQNETGYFNLGDLTSYDYIDFHYDSTMKWLFVMGKNTDIGSLESTDDDCVIIFKISFDETIHIDIDYIEPPTISYVSVFSTESFGFVIDTSYFDLTGKLVIAISAPDAIVVHENEHYSTGVIYHYEWSENYGFVSKMYTTPPSLTNDFKFGISMTIFIEGNVRRLFAISALDKYIYESIMPLCGDGVITTEVGEECEDVLENCIVDQCLCEDGYASDDGNCTLKCERSYCNCDEENSCTSCISELFNYTTMCQECISGYDLSNDECVTVCGNGIRTDDEDCDSVDHCDEDCTCYVGYVPADGLENKCVVSHETILFSWMLVQSIIAVLIVAFSIIYLTIRYLRKKRNRMNISGGGIISMYECGSTAKLSQFEENEAERFPLYFLNNSPFMYSIANEISFFEEGDVSHVVEKLETKKKYVFQLFVGNKSLNIASYALGDPRLDKEDYDLEFTPDKGNIRAGDIICIYGKVTPLRECAVKENFTLTVVNLNTTKSYIQNIPIEFGAED